MQPATRDELHRAGIDPAQPMLSERRRGEAGCWRVGDDRITRTWRGAIVHQIGYFSPAQIRARAAVARAHEFNRVWVDELADVTP